MAVQTIKGIAFPLILTSGKHTLVEGSALIEASIKTIISWPYFTRCYSDEFGSKVEETLEGQNDYILTNLIRRYVIDAISQWEKRVDLKSVEITRPSPEKIVVNLQYRIRDLDLDTVLTYGVYIN